MTRICIVVSETGGTTMKPRYKNARSASADMRSTVGAVRENVREDGDGLLRVEG